MKALVIGYQKSGVAASKLLKSKGYKVAVVADDRKVMPQNIDRLLTGLSFVVVSPGVRQDSPLVLASKKKGIPVIGELELGYNYLGGRIVAITGTNGKTTTTSLLGHLMQADNVFVGGNIGVPLCDVSPKTNSDSLTIAEVSSFQLASINKFKPNVAALLNVTPDHLNYHGNMQNYLDAKLNIFKNQTEEDFAVLSYDDPVVSKLSVSPAKTYYFSTKNRVNGCFASGGNIYFRDTTKTVPGYTRAVKIAATSDINLIGEHNLSNSLCALTCAILCGANVKTLAARLRTFMPVEHRLQFVTEIGGVKFINDSKATNTLSTVAAINSMKSPTTIILGGSDKGCDFDDIFKVEPSLVTNYVLMGETKNKLMQTALKWGKRNVFMAASLSGAVELAYRLCNSGDNVLFSPACASFDMFSCYQERGKCFCGIVKGLKQSEDNRIKDIKKT